MGQRIGNADVGKDHDAAIGHHDQLMELGLHR